MRKFYQSVETIQAEDGWIIHLDGKPIKTPQKTLLTVNSKGLADSIADEWRAQEVLVIPATMPLTQLASTAIDRTAPNIGDAIEILLEYAKTDLVCYRASEPDDLVAMQATLFDPLLEWFEARAGKGLIVARGLMPIEQPAYTLQATRQLLKQESAGVLTALQVGAALATSLVIPLALCAGEITAAEAYKAACCEELYQIKKWGEDDEARDRLNMAKVEFQVLEKFIGLLAKD